VVSGAPVCVHFFRFLVHVLCMSVVHLAVCGYSWLCAYVPPFPPTSFSFFPSLLAFELSHTTWLSDEVTIRLFVTSLSLRFSHLYAHVHRLVCGFPRRREREPEFVAFFRYLASEDSLSSRQKLLAQGSDTRLSTDVFPQKSRSRSSCS